MLDGARRLRNRSRVLRAAHSLTREPYYAIVGRLYPRGVLFTLPGDCAVRLHPRLQGIDPKRYEPQVAHMLDHFVKPGMMVVDVGAHVGLHTLRLSRRVGASGRVLAIEPSPANVGLLRRHLEWNGASNVTVIEAVVGACESEIDFSFRSDALDVGGFANSIAYANGDDVATIRMASIDSLCAGVSPGVIKVDTEGAEMLVMRGARRTIARAPVSLIIAFHPEAMSALHCTPRELVNFLDGCGYAGRHLDGRPAVDPGFEEIVFEKRDGA